MNVMTIILSKKHWYLFLVSKSFFRLHTLLTMYLESFECSWSSAKLFPWKPLPKRLAESGIIVLGWPDGVLSLGEECSVNLSSKSTCPKGILDLTLSEAGKIMNAFQDMGPNRLRFEYHPKWRGTLNLLTYITNFLAYVYCLS